MKILIKKFSPLGDRGLRIVSGLAILLLGSVYLTSSELAEWILFTTLVAIIIGIIDHGSLTFLHRHIKSESPVGNVIILNMLFRVALAVSIVGIIYLSMKLLQLGYPAVISLFIVCFSRIFMSFESVLQKLELYETLCIYRIGIVSISALLKLTILLSGKDAYLLYCIVSVEFVVITVVCILLALSHSLFAVPAKPFAIDTNYGLKKYAYLAVPIILQGIFVVSYTKLDIIAVSYFLNDEALIEYNWCIKILDVTVILTTAYWLSNISKISDQTQHMNLKGYLHNIYLRKKILEVLFINLFLFTCGAIFLLFIFPYVLGIFLTVGALHISILIIPSLLSIVNLLTGLIIVNNSWHFIMPLNAVMGALTAVVLNFVLVPRFEIFGALFSVLATQTFVSLLVTPMLIYFASQRRKIKKSARIYGD